MTLSVVPGSQDKRSPERSGDSLFYDVWPDQVDDS